MNYELYLQRLDEARETNSNIVSETVQEDNEHDINDIYLKILSYGLDSLTSEDSIRIEELAIQCPYIGGTAVYKARALYAMYSPASMFDDIKICNAVGVYKNGNTGNDKGKGIFDNENAFLKSLNPQFDKKVLMENDLLIYPNPANNQINIRYKNKKDSKLQIVNMLGNIEMEISLAKENQQVSVQTHSLHTGVYIYRQIENTAVIKSGKLIITN